MSEITTGHEEIQVVPTVPSLPVTNINNPAAITPQSPASVEFIKPNKKYVCFADAHEFARSLQLKTRKEWRLYVKGGMPEKVAKPDHIPAHPDGIYKIKGWQGWKYWLGTADKSLLQ